MPSKKRKPKPAGPPLSPNTLLTRQRDRQRKAWDKQMASGKKVNIPKLVLEGKPVEVKPKLTEAVDANGQRLTVTQLKNKLKRQRKQRPCHKCGEAGHKKTACKVVMPADEAKTGDSICFGCRQFGHLLRDCPTSSQNTCYRCGSASHAARDCTVKVDSDDEEENKSKSMEYPLANCFICGDRGHIARVCPKSDHGVFPQGGVCKRCGKSDHKAKHCSLPETEEERDKRRAERALKHKKRKNTNESAEVDGNVAFESMTADERKKKKAKKAEEITENDDERDIKEKEREKKKKERDAVKKVVKF